MKIQDLLNNIYDKQIKLQLIDHINIVMSRRPRIDIFQGIRTIDCYKEEV